MVRTYKKILLVSVGSWFNCYCILQNISFGNFDKSDFLAWYMYILPNTVHIIKNKCLNVPILQYFMAKLLPDHYLINAYLLIISIEILS